MSECNNRNPSPPCKEGYEEKENVLKSGKKRVCCYKSKKTKKNCNNRNPSPPCKEGFSERENISSSGEKSICCYKTKKEPKIKREKVSKPKSLCSKIHPEPPCLDGMVEKIKVNKKGVSKKCCYKDKKTKKKITGFSAPEQTKDTKKVVVPKKIQKKFDCTPNYPSPPCKEGTVEKKKTNKAGDEKICCYKDDSNKNKGTKNSKIKEKVSLFTTHDSLFEFDPMGEIRNPKKHLPARLSRSPLGLLVSEKYDGHRCLYDPIINEGLSRTGKTSFNLPEKWKKALSISKMPLDGEIFLPGLPASQVAALRTNTELSNVLWKNVAKFYVFDLPTHEGTYTERINEYTKIVEDICKEWKLDNPDEECPIKAVHHDLMKQPDEIESKFNEVMKNKHTCNIDLTKYEIECKPQPSEGLVLSIPDAKYEFKRSLKKYKYKDRIEFDAVVIEPHPLKQSLKVYRLDCEKPPHPDSSVFYVSTEGRPKEHFIAGDILKCSALGYAKGNDSCPSKPKMAKIIDFRSEEVAISRKKIKLPPPPKDGPNEKIGQYFDNVAKGYFDKKNSMKGLAYKKQGAIARRTLVKITESNYHEVFGKGSIGQQCKCVLEGKSFEECIGDRLKP